MIVAVVPSTAGSILQTAVCTDALSAGTGRLAHGVRVRVYNQREGGTMPSYDLGLLITLNIVLTLAGITLAVIGVWSMIRHVTREHDDTRQTVREVAEIQREVAFMIRRQYGDIDRDLQEIKDLLGGR
jgi:hypothetical protein